MVGEPDLTVEIGIQNVVEWLSTDLPAWATRTRSHASLRLLRTRVLPRRRI